MTSMLSSARIARGPIDRHPDPLPALLQQIVARLGAPCVIERAVSRPWCSALFQGRRHVIALKVEGAAAHARADRFAHDLGKAEWTLPAQFVADIVVDDRQPGDDDAVHLTLSALTIEDW